jgi:GTPase SAR1 family protein
MKYKLTVLFLGVEKSGKSSFINRLFNKRFYKDYKPTIGLDYTTHDIVKEKQGGDDTINLNFRDASGMARFKSIVLPFFKFADVYCFTIDATQDVEVQKQYFESLFPNMNQQSHINFIITKSDLVTSDQLELLQKQLEHSIQGLQEKHKSNIKLYVSSAKNMEQEEIFTQFLSDCKDTAIQFTDVPDLKNLFKDFSNNPELEDDDAGREAAIQVFQQQLNNANNDINRIAALVKIAEPYINRHRHVWLDNHLGKTTNSWRKCLKQAREVALSNLSSQVNNNQTSRDVLSYWRRENLFAKHRNCSVLTGAFGDTNAQHKLDKLMKRLR